MSKTFHRTFSLEDPNHELHVHTTDEGIVFDIYDIPSGEIVASTYMFTDEMAEMCMHPNGDMYEFDHRWEEWTSEMQERIS